MTDQRSSSVVQQKVLDRISQIPTGNLLLQPRYDNPDPAPSTSNDDRFADVTLSERHIVPYSRLLSLLDKYRAAVDDADHEDGDPAFTGFAGFLSENDEMGATTLGTLNIITPLAKDALSAAGITP